MGTQGLVILVLILLTVYFFVTRAEHLQRYKNITTHPRPREERFRDNIQPIDYDASMAFHKINFDKDAAGNTDADYYLAGKLYNQ
jgi:hypothetical protein